MNKKIASLFATVGFDIDTTGLERLDGHLRTIRGSTANLSRNLRIVNSEMNTTSSRMRNLARAAEAVTKFNNLGGKYVGLAAKIKESETAIARFGRVLGLIEPRLDSTNMRLSLVTRSYQQLAAAVREANRQISQTPSRTPRPVNTGGFGSPRAGGGGSGSNGGIGGFLGGILGVAGHFTPTGLLGGSALGGAAVGVNEIRKAGQEQQRMENVLLFSSVTKDAAKAQAEYARNLKFVRDESLRLGLDTAELGKAFAQVNMAAGDKMSEKSRKQMFTNMSEYIMVTGAGQEDQKLIFKAVNQMFSLGRIMAEEMNQLTERGVPRQQLYDVAMKKYGVKDVAAVLNLQKQGKLKPEDILPILFKQFADTAKKTGAYDKMLKSSMFKQNQFKVAMKQMSADIMDAGLDKALAVFFETLTAGIPYLKAFLKGLMGVAKGLTEITKIVYDSIKAWANWIGANSRTVGFVSFLIGLFAVFAAKVTGASVAFGGLGKVLSTIGRKVPLLALMLALWYLTQEYDKYMNGEDSWMNTFASKMVGLIEKVRLFGAELKFLYAQLTNFKFTEAATNGIIKDIGKRFVDMANPSGLGGKIGKWAGDWNDPVPPPPKPNLPSREIPSSIKAPQPTGKPSMVYGRIDLNVEFDKNGNPIPPQQQKVYISGMRVP